MVASKQSVAAVKPSRDSAREIRDAISILSRGRGIRVLPPRVLKRLPISVELEMRNVSALVSRDASRLSPAVRALAVRAASKRLADSLRVASHLNRVSPKTFKREPLAAALWTITKHAERSPAWFPLAETALRGFDRVSSGLARRAYLRELREDEQSPLSGVAARLLSRPLKQLIVRDQTDSFAIGRRRRFV